MQRFLKSTGLAFALVLLGSSAFAAVTPNESVTVQGAQGGLTADLDPAKDHPDGFTAEQIDRDINPADRYSAFQEFSKGLVGPLNDFYDWQGVYESGSFIPTHEFREAGLLCRDFLAAGLLFLLAFLALACCAIPYVFYFYGARIRKFSRFAFHDEDEVVVPAGVEKV